LLIGYAGKFGGPSQVFGQLPVAGCIGRFGLAAQSLTADAKILYAHLTGKQVFNFQLADLPTTEGKDVVILHGLSPFNQV
jgi:hypothetical protein